MPIQPDPNIPTQPGYLQVVSFHLLSRDGEKIDLEDGTFIVENITDLDAHLALEQDPDREATDGRQQLAKAFVLVRHDKNAVTNKYEQWVEFKVDADGERQVKTNNIRNATNWQRFAYTSELNPISDRPCYLGEEFNRYASFVTDYAPEGTYGLGDDPPATKVVLSNSQDAALFASNTPVSVPGTVQSITANATTCDISSEVFTDFEIVGWQFNPAEYPKETPTAPDPKVKLLWLAGLRENV